MGSKASRVAHQQPVEQPDGLWSKYEIGAKLGSGSFGQVFEVKLLSNQTTTGAVKITPRDGDQDEFWSDVAVFYREVAILQSLEHCNVVKFLDSFADEDNLYLVTEVCGGGQVFQQIVSLKRFHETDAAAIAMQMLLATKYIHGQCVMHRDIKAENFMFSEPSPDSTVKLIDFGMSSTFKDGDVFHEVCGSRFYLAPEMLKQRYDHRIDMWAIGVTVYLLCCGRYPFKIGSKNKHADLLCRPLEWSRKVTLSPETKDFIQRILKTNPVERVTAKEALAHPFIGYLEEEHMEKQRRNSQVSVGSQASLNSNLSESVKQAYEVVRATQEGKVVKTHGQTKPTKSITKELVQRTAKYMHNTQRSTAKETSRAKAADSSARIVAGATGAAASSPQSSMGQSATSDAQKPMQGSTEGLVAGVVEMGSWDRQVTRKSDSWDRQVSTGSKMSKFDWRVSNGSEMGSFDRQASKGSGKGSCDGQVTKSSDLIMGNSMSAQPVDGTGSTETNADGQRASTEKGSLLSQLAPTSTGRRRSSNVAPIPETPDDTLLAGEPRKLEPLALTPLMPGVSGG